MGVFIQRLGLLSQSAAAPSVDNDWDRVRLLLGYEGGTFVDESNSPVVVNLVGDALLDSDQSLFGTQAGHVKTTGGGRIDIPSTEVLNFGGDPWTIETWFYTDGGDTFRLVMGRWKSPDKSYAIWRHNSNLRLSVSINGTTSLFVIDVAAPSGWSAQWYYCAADYDGTDLRLYLWDPVLESSTNGINSVVRTLKSSQEPLTLGSDSAGGNDHYGWFDETRITVGVARYTGTLIIPTAIFPRQGPSSWIDNFASSTGENPRFAADFSGVVNGQYFWDSNDAKTFDDTVDVTRTDDAGYWDSAGVFKFAGTDVHRLDHDPDTNVRLGLLREDEQTTIIDRSKDTNVNPWFKVNVTSAVDTVTAPDGFGTADAVKETTANGQHRVYSNPGGLTATPWTTVFRISPVGREWYKIRLDVSGQFKGAYVQLTGNGTIGVVDTGYICRLKKLGNDWWDVELTRTVATTAAHFPSIHAAEADNDDSYVGDTAKGWNQARANLINSKVGSSLINMPASTHITRNADIIKVKVDGALPHYDYVQGQGTMAGTFTLKIVGDLDQTLMNYSTEGSNHRIECYVSSAGTLFGRVTVSGSVVSTVDLGSVSDDTEFTVAVSFIDNALRGSKNGGSVISDTGAMTVPDADALYLGHRSASGLDGANVLWISKIMYYANAFDGAELQSAG